MDKQAAREITKRWLGKMVIGLNLCPFAQRVVEERSLRLSVSEAVEYQSIIKAVLQELDALQNSHEEDVATSLLIFSHGLKDFDQYLMLLDQAQSLLEQVGLEGVFQIASFHPDYFFSGVEQTDLGNYTNRSPLPMLHFIREVQIDRALENFPNPEKIPEKNIDTLNSLGPEVIRRLYDSLQLS